jgi:hypothetical protein
VSLGERCAVERCHDGMRCPSAALGATGVGALSRESSRDFNGVTCSKICDNLLPVVRKASFGAKTMSVPKTAFAIDYQGRDVKGAFEVIAKMMQTPRTRVAR